MNHPLSQYTLYSHHGLLVPWAAEAAAAGWSVASILAGRPLVHSCHLEEASPAVGAHTGPGGLLVGWMPHDLSGHA